MNKWESNLSTDNVSTNLPFLGPLPGGDGYDCFLETHLLPGDSRPHNLDRLGVPYIEMIDITRAPIIISSMKNDYIHTLKRYEEKLGE